MSLKPALPPAPDVSDIITADTLAPRRLPDLELVGYLHRWCMVPRGKQGNQYLHHILAPDHPVLHDHPWHFKSMILAGGYTEMTPDGAIERRAGDVYEKRATDLHYISRVEPDTWTMIFTGPTLRDWGFSVRSAGEDQWVSHEDFEDRLIEIITRNGYENT